MKHIYYLDTSGLNFLADRVKKFDGLRIIKEQLNIEFYLSSITLWEVLLNSNAKRSDYLVYWAQFNCSPKLLKSPSELLIEYLINHCPSKDRRRFYAEPFSNNEMATLWENIHGKIERNIDSELGVMRERSQPLRSLSKKLKVIITDMCDSTRDGYTDDPFHKKMEEFISVGKHHDLLTKENERIIKISLIFLFFVVCVGIDLEAKIIDRYWNDLDIEDVFERLDYLVETHPDILKRGPVVEMAVMADVQIRMQNSKSRGLFHDCLHTIYCYYSSHFVTGDVHFASLKSKIRHHAFDGILMTDEISKLYFEAFRNLPQHIRQIVRLC